MKRLVLSLALLALTACTPAVEPAPAELTELHAATSELNNELLRARDALEAWAEAIEASRVGP